MTRIRCTRTQLRELIADYAASIDWLPALPLEGSPEDEQLEFDSSESSGPFSFNWHSDNWHSEPGIRNLCYLSLETGMPVLTIEQYAGTEQIHRQVIYLEMDTLQARGMIYKAPVKHWIIVGRNDYPYPFNLLDISSSDPLAAAADIHEELCQKGLTEERIEEIADSYDCDVVWEWEDDSTQEEMQ